MKLLRPILPCLAAGLIAWPGCRREPDSSSAVKRHSIPSTAQQSLPDAVKLDPCTFALAPHSGLDRLDQEIIRLQKEVASSPQPQLLLEKLGWMYVKKARVSFDPGFYKLAEQCALCLESKQAGSLEASLLRGHALQNMHRFKEAEPLARKLVSQRGAPFDYGLLGDVLMEIGRLDEAIGAYQKMMDLKPDLHAYARVAHIRWLKGDVVGAAEAMQMAADAASPQDPESAAWAHARLALYQFQAGQADRARRSAEASLSFQKDYPPSLLLQGRQLMAEGKRAQACELLLHAAQLNPLPEYQWALTESLRDAGRLQEAEAVEIELKKSGAVNDPRTYALFLATRHEQAQTALRLAEAELQGRADVLTCDAMAWSLAAAGRWDEARQYSRRALAEGTADARLFLHAGIIAAKSGATEDARSFLDKASALQQMLLPSEREELRRTVAPGRAAAADAGKN